MYKNDFSNEKALNFFFTYSCDFGIQTVTV